MVARKRPALEAHATLCSQESQRLPSPLRRSCKSCPTARRRWAMTERVPRVLKTKHCASFNVLDPFGHMSTQHYLTFFLEHRWIGYREQLGMSLVELAKLPFIFVARKVGIEFLQPVFG